MSAIEKYQQPLDMIQSIDDLARLSLSISKSNYYKDVVSPDQVGVKLMVARELGLGINAISFIYPVKGKITIGYQILIALVKRSGKYDMRFRDRTEKCCRIEWFERNDEGKLESVGFSQYTPEDAKRAGLLGNPNYQKNPVEMLVARATSSGFNSYAPECAGGGLYSLGELDDPTPVPAPAAPARKPAAAAPAPTTTLPREQVIDAEVVDAAHDSPESEPSRDVAPEGDVAASTTSPVQRIRAMLAELSESDKKTFQLIKDSCVALGVATTPKALYARFGDDAFDSISLRVAFAEALKAEGAMPPIGQAQGEVEPSAESFDEFLKDDTARNIEAAERAQSEAAARIKSRERMAKAGSYGE